MKIGIIGSGQVAQSIAPKLLELGNEVMISSRDTAMEKKEDWGKLPSVNMWVAEMSRKGLRASGGSFSEAAGFGELIFNCTEGSHSADALMSAGEANLKGKIMIDLANPLDFSAGEVPALTVCNSISLAETLQNFFPGTKIVKALNHVAAEIMTDPGLLSEDTVLFMAGNDIVAKGWVMETVLKKWFGWKNVLDLGPLACARGMEMYLPLWASIYNVMKTPKFNMKLVLEKAPEKKSAVKAKTAKTRATVRKTAGEPNLVAAGTSRNNNNKRRK